METSSVSAPIPTVKAYQFLDTNVDTVDLEPCRSMNVGLV